MPCLKIDAWGRDAILRLVTFSAAWVPDFALGIDEGVGVAVGAKRDFKHSEASLNLRS